MNKLHVKKYVTSLIRAKTYFYSTDVAVTEKLDDLVIDEEATALREAEIEKRRNKSRLSAPHFNLVNGRKPYEESKCVAHETVKYNRKIFGKYGTVSGVNPNKMDDRITRGGWLSDRVILSRGEGLSDVNDQGVPRLEGQGQVTRDLIRRVSRSRIERGSPEQMGDVVLSRGEGLSDVNDQGVPRFEGQGQATNGSIRRVSRSRIERGSRERVVNVVLSRGEGLSDVNHLEAARSEGHVGVEGGRVRRVFSSRVERGSRGQMEENTRISEELERPSAKSRKRIHTSSICWPTKDELAVNKLKEHVAYPYTIQQVMLEAKQAREEKQRVARARDAEVAARVTKLQQWKKEMQDRLDKKMAISQAAREKKERLIDEVRRHFGFKLDPRDDRFKEMLEKREKEQRKQEKQMRKEAKEKQAVARLQQKSQEMS